MRVHVPAALERLSVTVDPGNQLAQMQTEVQARQSQNRGNARARATFQQGPVPSGPAVKGAGSLALGQPKVWTKCEGAPRCRARLSGASASTAWEGLLGHPDPRSSEQGLWAPGARRQPRPQDGSSALGSQPLRVQGDTLWSQ